MPNTMGAIELAFKYGQIGDPKSNRLWVIDQMVRLLADDCYEDLVAEYEDKHRAEASTWHTGIAP